MPDMDSNTIIEKKNFHVIVVFKSRIPFKNKTKKIIFLGVTNMKQIYYKLCNYLLELDFSGFNIVSIKNLDTNETVIADTIVNVKSGNMIH